jgi:hypothetical protein
MTVYKIWIHIEQIDEEHDHHHEITELQAAGIAITPHHPTL